MTSSDPILLLSGSLSLGGIETMVVRLANHLAENGHKVLLAHTGGELKCLIRNPVRDIEYSSDEDLIAKLRLELFDASQLKLFSVDPTTAAIGLMLESSPLLPRVKHLTGVYHPRAYFLDGEDRLRFTINRMVAEVMGEQSLVFMNEESRSSHARHFDRLLHSANVVPVPVARASSKWSQPTGRPYRIISVGRLVGFKKYNLTAPGIVHELRNAGYDVEWDIFGSGALYGDMLERIASTKTSPWLRLHPPIAYQEFQKTVSQFDVFVGMGTAALEAAITGMPVIAAIDGEGQKTYGYLHNLPFGNLGEVVDYLPQITIKEAITQLMDMSSGERLRVGELCRSHAEQYSIDAAASSLLRIYDSLKPQRRFIRKRLVGIAYREATVGITRQAISRLIKSVRSVPGRKSRIG